MAEKSWNLVNSSREVGSLLYRAMLGARVNEILSEWVNLGCVSFLKR